VIARTLTPGRAGRQASATEICESVITVFTAWPLEWPTDRIGLAVRRRIVRRVVARLWHRS